MEQPAKEKVPGPLEKIKQGIIDAGEYVGERVTEAGIRVAKSGPGRFIRGVAKIPEYVGAHYNDGRLEDKQFYREGFSPIYNALGRGVKWVDMKIEGLRFRLLQMNKATVEKRRLSLENAKTDIGQHTAELEEKLRVWGETSAHEVGSLNQRLEKYDTDGSFRLFGVWQSPEQLANELQLLHFSLGMRIAGEKLSSVKLDDPVNINASTMEPYSAEEFEVVVAEGKKAELVRQAELANLEEIQRDVQKLLSQTRTFEREVDSTINSVGSAQEKLDKQRANAGVPEVVIRRRAELFASRERLLYNLHDARLARLNSKRRLQEVGQDVWQLLNGRDPSQIREERESKGVAQLRAGLEKLAEQAEVFDNPEVLAERLETEKSAAEFGNRPLVYQIEELISKSSLPDDMRAELLLQCIPFEFQGMKKLRLDARLDIRYRPARLELIESLLDYLPGAAARIPREESEMTSQAA